MKHLKKTLVLVVIGILATASAAFAGFILYSGAGGSATGSFATAQGGSAVTIAKSGTWAALDSGQAQDYAVSATNNDPNTAHTVTNLSATFTTTDSSGADDSAQCAQYLSLSGWSVDSGSPIPAGQTVPGVVNITLSSAAPAAPCAGGSWTVTFSGTTS